MANAETKIQNNIIAALRRRGVWVFRLSAGTNIGHTPDGRRFANRGVPAGTPDLICLLPGSRVVWLEVKTKTGKLNNNQVKWHGHAGRIGHAVYVVRTTQEAVDALEEQGAFVMTADEEPDFSEIPWTENC